MVLPHLVLPSVSRTSLGTTPLPFSKLQPQPPEIREAVGSQEAVEAKEQEGSSRDEDTPGRPGKRPSAGRHQQVSVTNLLGPTIQKKICLGYF